MGIAIEPREVLTERWADHVERAAYDSLLHGSTHQQISWGLACVPGGAYTLTRRAGAALSLTLPSALCEVLGVRAGDRVRYGVTESGMLVVSPVALADLPEFTRAAAELADRLLVQRYGQRMLKHFEKFCVRCGKLYCAKSRSSRFCPVCRVHRQRVQSREYWLRKGKLTPSYHARLKNLPRARGKVETSEHRVADDTAAESTLGVTGVST